MHQKIQIFSNIYVCIIYIYIYVYIWGEMSNVHETHIIVNIVNYEPPNIVRV